MGEQIPASVMRSGTSRGVYMSRDDVPASAEGRARVLTQVIGSPDDGQFDGLGGGRTSSSKVMLVAASADPSVDVDYTFAQVGLTEATVDETGNCGNLSAGVGYWAVMKRLVLPQDGTVTVRMRNSGTGQHLVAEVPSTVEGPIRAGTTAEAGISRPGVPVGLTFVSEGSPGIVARRDALSISRMDGNVCLVDFGDPTAIVWVQGDPPRDPAAHVRDELADSGGVASTLEALRRDFATDFGPALEKSESLPRIVFAWTRERGAVDVVAASMGTIHHAVPVTTATALAQLCGTEDGSLEQLTIRHAKGTLKVEIVRDTDGDCQGAKVVRAVRHIMEGVVFVDEGKKEQDWKASDG